MSKIEQTPLFPSQWVYPWCMVKCMVTALYCTVQEDTTSVRLASSVQSPGILPLQTETHFLGFKRGNTHVENLFISITMGISMAHGKMPGQVTALS